MNYGRAVGNMNETNDLASRLLRLPLWIGLSNHQQDGIFSVIREFNE
jgi:dTDP-4-amino-4,6-dideoxygalactose transaminase